MKLTGSNDKTVNHVDKISKLKFKTSSISWFSYLSNITEDRIAEWLARFYAVGATWLSQLSDPITSGYTKYDVYTLHQILCRFEILHAARAACQACYLITEQWTWSTA